MELSKDIGIKYIGPHVGRGRKQMADNNGGMGIAGVLIGAILVLVVGGGILFATGNLGNNTSTIKIELPKVSGGK
jgi:hypothetical protein